MLCNQLHLSSYGNIADVCSVFYWLHCLFTPALLSVRYNTSLKGAVETWKGFVVCTGLQGCLEIQVRLPLSRPRWRKASLHVIGQHKVKYSIRNSTTSDVNLHCTLQYVTIVLVGDQRENCNFDSSNHGLRVVAKTSPFFVDLDIEAIKKRKEERKGLWLWLIVSIKLLLSHLALSILWSKLVCPLPLLPEGILVPDSPQNKWGGHLLLWPDCRTQPQLQPSENTAMLWGGDSLIIECRCF